MDPSVKRQYLCSPSYTTYLYLSSTNSTFHLNVSLNGLLGLTCLGYKICFLLETLLSCYMTQCSLFPILYNTGRSIFTTQVHNHKTSLDNVILIIFIFRTSLVCSIYVPWKHTNLNVTFISYIDRLKVAHLTILVVVKTSNIKSTIPFCGKLDYLSWLGLL